MKILYYEKSDKVIISMAADVESKTITVNDDIYVDVNEYGEMLKIEVFNACGVIPDISVLLDENAHEIEVVKGAPKRCRAGQEG